MVQCVVGVVVFAGALGAEPLERVVLQLKWRHQFQFAGYYAAVAQGYYREEGLEVELREAEPGRDHVEAVFSGEAQYGVGNSDLLLSRAAGRPVVVLAPIFQHSPLVLVARETDGIGSMQDLHGRPMMMVDSEKAEILAYFKHEGVNLAGLDVRPHTHRIEDFIEGKIDAMSAYVTDQPFFLREADVPHLSFFPRAGGIDFYGDTLFTTEEQIRRHPAQVRAFLRASLRGWDHALAHPEEIVDLILADYTRRHGREHLLFEADKTAELMHPGLIEVGHNNPGRWRHMADTYAEFGLLPRDFSLKGFLYDPDPKADLRWVYWTLGVLGVAAVAAWGWILPLRRLNARLRREIAEHAATEEALRRARDEAERTSAEKSRFIAFITHEVRTPLGGFVGLIDLLREAPLTADQNANLALMEDSANSLVGLISNALEQEKISAGRLVVHHSPVVPGEILTAVADLFRGTARQRGLQLVVSLGDNLPASIHTDPHRLRQILQNLVANALKFTAAGSVSLHVENGAPGHVRFLVRDTGPGIPRERRGRIFEPYAQGDSLVAREYGGTGLGLPISRQLARLLGGDLTVGEAAGPGAVLVLELPVGSAADAGD